MVKIKSWLIMVLFAVGFVAAHAYSEEQMAARHTTDLGKPASVRSLTGTHVTNQKGEELGRIDDFVIDSKGKTTFVILAYGGFLRVGERRVAIPFNFFAYDRMEGHFVLDTTTEKLDSAPAFSMLDLYSERWAEKVYRHFGQAPYWTEGELVEKGVTPLTSEPMNPDVVPIYAE